MNDSSPHSPEARRKRLRQAGAHLSRELKRPRPVTHPLEITKRVAVGVYTDGFIHAGNLAYLSLVTLFPFFIVATAAATIFGRTEDGMAGVSAFLSNRSEEHTSELQSLMRISYAVFCLKNKKINQTNDYIVSSC